MVGGPARLARPEAAQAARRYGRSRGARGSPGEGAYKVELVTDGGRRTTKLFDTDQLPPPPLAQPLGRTANSKAEAAQGGACEQPPRPAARVLAHGNVKAGLGVALFDEEGNIYRLGDLVFFMAKESTPEGAEAEEKKERLLHRRRHGEKFYSLSTLTFI